MVARIKASPGYNASVGALLRTEPTGTPAHPQTAVGLIRSLHLDAQGRAVVAFSKLGGAVQGGNLYMARGTDAAPGMKVGTFTHTPAVDATPLKTPGLPETCTYTVVNLLNDQEVGTRSPALSIVVGG